ncbi:MAG: hypothetical protein M1825_006222 [Sarcosagium campestre]|nr:MAG: hypothetical protein M1825_006222 [Sarcosagium campestre]
MSPPGWSGLVGEPRPRYYICRDNGDLVPLIAADELDPRVSLLGVPRALRDLSNTLGMVNLGPHRTHGMYYEFVGDIPLASGAAGAASAGLGGDQMGLALGLASSPSPAAAAGAAASTAATTTAGTLGGRAWEPESSRDGTQDVINAIVAASQPAVVSARAAGPGEVDKEYCTHWIFHGECAFVHSPRGCKYKHEMPLDAAGLAKVGLKDLPRWFQERQRPRFAGASGAREWRAPTNPRPRPGGDPTAQFTLEAAPAEDATRSSSRPPTNHPTPARVTPVAFATLSLPPRQIVGPPSASNVASASASAGVLPPTTIATPPVSSSAAPPTTRFPGGQVRHAFPRGQMPGRAGANRAGHAASSRLAPPTGPTPRMFTSSRPRMRFVDNFVPGRPVSSSSPPSSSSATASASVAVARPSASASSSSSSPLAGTAAAAAGRIITEEDVESEDVQGGVSVQQGESQSRTTTRTSERSGGGVSLPLGSSSHTSGGDDGARSSSVNHFADLVHFDNS